MDSSDSDSQEPDRRRREYRRAEDRRQHVDQLEALVALSTNVGELSVAVGKLRRELAHRPTSTELSNRRRRMLATLIVGLLLVVFAFDTHVENCGPGARAEDSIRAVVDAPPAGTGTLEEVQRLIENTPPRPVCDLLTPIHGHNDEPWPTPWSIAGGILYLIGAVALYLWARPRSPKEDA